MVPHPLSRVQKLFYHSFFLLSTLFFIFFDVFFELAAFWVPPFQARVVVYHFPLPFVNSFFHFFKFHGQSSTSITRKARSPMLNAPQARDKKAIHSRGSAMNRPKSLSIPLSESPSILPRNVPQRVPYVLSRYFRQTISESSMFPQNIQWSNTKSPAHDHSSMLH